MCCILPREKMSYNQYNWCLKTVKRRNCAVYVIKSTALLSDYCFNVVFTVKSWWQMNDQSSATVPIHKKQFQCNSVLSGHWQIKLYSVSLFLLLDLFQRFDDFSLKFWNDIGESLRAKQSLGKICIDSNVFRESIHFFPQTIF